MIKVVLISSLVAICYGQKLTIDIFYESLCPDSLDFIKNQLEPAWDDIAPYVNLKLVPFGKSISFNNGEDFQCQHGPKECMGNRIQSCALRGIKHPSQQVKYVDCFMRNFRKGVEGEHAENCTLNTGIKWEYVKACYESNMGTLLQLKAEQETKLVSPRFIPTIIYSNIFDQRAQDDSLEDFRTVACSIIKTVHVEACSDSKILRL